VKLHHWILLALGLGIVFGVLTQPEQGLVPIESAALTEALKQLGQIFLSLIKMAIIPLVLSSLIYGMASLGRPAELGRIGGFTLGYYVASTAAAVTLGLVLANVAAPGRRVGPEAKERLLKSYQEEAGKRIAGAEKQERGFWPFVRSIVPDNPVTAMIGNPPNLLGLIFFSLLLGFSATLVPAARRKPFLDFCESAMDVVVRMIGVVMWFAPIGVFCLIADVVRATGPQVLGLLLGYALVVVGGLVIHMVGFYSLMLWGVARRSPWEFFRAMRPALATAFSTSSSAATLPVNMTCVTGALKVPAPVASFVLPLGATINMDGTALYQGVATVFIAQVYGRDLAVAEQMTIVLMATLASIGTPSVPGAGVVMLLMILAPLNLPAEGLALILGVDRLLDMCRTTVNIAGDAVCTTMVDRFWGARFRAP
jgi:Na+/H+-dicarboxylate symporter